MKNVVTDDSTKRGGSVNTGSARDKKKKKKDLIGRRGSEERTVRFCL